MHSLRILPMGIIPAGAGRRFRRWRWPGRGRDHPRGCGEKLHRAPRRNGQDESSPRVRGEVPELSIDVQHHGIIPAGAGRSTSKTPPPPPAGDHPRGCGEKQKDKRGSARFAGSSPRVRGEGHPRQEEGRDRGIIPAGAGRREGQAERDMKAVDHPRGCGEKLPRSRITAPPPGSSPRVRGEEVAGDRDVDALGIIPAGAGRSRRYLGGRAPPRDHPRGCGEKRITRLRAQTGLGSSPRVRGEVAPIPDDDGSLGIIPAGAGRSDWS